MVAIIKELGETMYCEAACSFKEAASENLDHGLIRVLKVDSFEKAQE